MEILPPQRASVSSDTEGNRTEHSVPDHRYKLFELLPLPVEANTGTVSRMLNESKLDRLMEIYNRVGIHWLEGGHLTGRKDGEWEATQAETIFSPQTHPR